MIKKASFLLLSLCLLYVIIPGSNSFAFAKADSKSKDKASESSMRFKFTTPTTEPTITDPTEIQERLDKLEKEALEIYGRTKSFEDVGEYLEANGLINAGEEGTAGMTTMSTVNNNVVVITPSVYYDSLTGVYRVSSGFAWKSDSSGKKYWRDDKSWWCCDLMYTSDDVGGMDQFGLYFDDNTGLQNFGGHKLTLWNSDDSITEQLTTPAASTSQGVSFTGQDTIRFRGAGFGNQGGLDYNWDDGVITTYFKTTSAASGVTHEVRAQFDHSYDDTTITGVAIQPYGIAVYWGTSGKAWTATSSSPYYWYT